ncbi:MAG: hypothetical protein H6Q03_1603 [Acidobacteria bacterium]|nr:hypothetical protein [Acidobacteriota bacterium]
MRREGSAREEGVARCRSQGVHQDANANAGGRPLRQASEEALAGRVPLPDVVLEMDALARRRQVALERVEQRAAVAKQVEGRGRGERRFVEARREPHLAQHVRLERRSGRHLRELPLEQGAQAAVAEPAAPQAARAEYPVDRRTDQGQEGQAEDPGQGRGRRAPLGGDPERDEDDPGDLEQECGELPVHGAERIRSP